MTGLSKHADLAENEKGISVLDLIGTPLTGSHTRAVMEALAAAYRTPYDKNEWKSFMHLLHSQLIEQGWSAERFSAVANWIALNKPFAAITLADFFSAPTSTLHSYSWVLREVHKDSSAQKRMEGYRYPRVPEGLWRYAEGGLPLPLEQFYPFKNLHANRPSVTAIKAKPCPPPPDVREALERLSESQGTRSGLTSLRDVLPKSEPVDLPPLDPEVETMLRQAEQEAKARVGK